MDNALSLMLFAPLAGTLAIVAIPRAALNLIRGTATVATFITCVIAGVLSVQFDRATTDFQFVERYAWIPAFDIHFVVGVDGLSMSMLLLTSLLSFVCVIASWGVDRGAKAYFALLLLLTTSMIGVFIALDLVLFFLFWELTLLPMYFLIGVWGGPRRAYAANKFLIFTMAGSVLILLAIVTLYFATNPRTFDITELRLLQDQYPHSLQYILWLALFIGFAVKVPAVPFHTWLPDAHVEAPTAISVLLAGVLLKMGAYGILRINYDLLPLATGDLAFVCLGVLGAVNIVYGALCALGQTDLKRLIAYSSISHMGYVMLGMATFNAQGMHGAALQMVSHGVIVAMLFLLAGALHDRAHHYEIDGYGGLAPVMPVYTAFAALAFFAALGMPGFAAFVSEVLVLLGAWQRFPELAAIGAAAAVLTAGYFLWTFQRLLLGPTHEGYAQLSDLRGRELVVLTPLAVLVVALGLHPQPALDLLDASLQRLTQGVAPFAR